MSKASDHVWIVFRPPRVPKHRSIRAWRKLSMKQLTEDCWAATVNAEDAMYVASEAWARVADLVDMLEGSKPIDHKMLQQLRVQREHVIRCQTGSCAHEYAALVRGGSVHRLIDPPSEEVAFNLDTFGEPTP